MKNIWTFSFSLIVLVSSAFSENYKGKVIDEETKLPLTRATILIVNKNDTTQKKGIYSNETGEFSISRKDVFQSSVLTIKYVGYRDTSIIPTFSNENIYNTILLRKKSSAEEVVITGEKQQIEYSAGKKVVNVDNAIASKGGNALDVLQTMPGVSVDADGNVSLRGSNTVNLMIDNKPIQLFGNANQVLQNLPAAVLDKVEIITNPGAKYDAEGQTGIINIQLKKNANSGFNGTVNSTIGSIDTYGFSTQLNNSFDDVNIFYGGDLSNGKHKRVIRVDAEFDDNNGNNTMLTQRNGNQLTSSLNGGVRLGMDYSISEADKLTVSGDFRYSNYESRIAYRATLDNLIVQNSPESYFRTNSITEGPFGFGSLGVNYSHNFGEKGFDLTFDGYYFPSVFDQKSFFENVETDKNYGDINLANRNFYKTNMVGYSHSFQLQTDLRYPISEKSAWEMGVKGYLVGIRSEFLFDRMNNITNEYYRDILQSTRASHQDNVFSSYVNYSNSIGDIEFQLGLRGEMTTNKLFDFLQNNNDSLNFYREFFNLFPNCSFTYPISELSSLQLSYSRRINRPDSPALNPFLDTSDSLIWRSGNPQLLPEFTHSMEFGYLVNTEIGTVNSEVFLRQTNQLMNPRFREKVNDNVVIEKPRNIGTALNYGISVSGSFDLLKEWKLNTDISAFHQSTDGVDGSTVYNEKSFGWIGKIISTFMLPANTIIQIYADYTSPVVITQGRRYEFSLMNLAVKKDFFDRKLSLSFNWIDFLNTARFGGVVEGDNFSTELLNQRDFTFMQLSVSYRINDSQNNRRRKVPDGGGSLIGGGNSI